MNTFGRYVSVFVVALAGMDGVARAQPGPPAPPSPQDPPTAAPTPPDPTPAPAPAMDAAAPAPSAVPPSSGMIVPAPPTIGADAQAKPVDHAPKQPKRGDFDAGGQLRFPNGPDATGKYATYNWIVADAKGRYFIFDWLTVNGTVPVVVKHPDMLMDGSSPSWFGGFSARIDAMVPKLPKLPLLKNEMQIGLALTLAEMREGAMLLSDKDFPKFAGGFQPGLNVGPVLKVKLSSVVDFATTPVWIHQGGTMKPLEAVQIPVALVLRLGSLVQASADLGVYSGADYSFGGSGGGRVAAGGSLTVKIGPIIAHAGAGVASLLTGPTYPTIGDSVYVDVNVKYAK
jgi:hypothetical protein